jgi:hypothetical protein
MKHCMRMSNEQCVVFVGRSVVDTMEFGGATFSQ